MFLVIKCGDQQLQLLWFSWMFVVEASLTEEVKLLLK